MAKSDIDVRLRLRDARRFQADAKKSKESLEGFRGAANRAGSTLKQTGGSMTSFGSQMSRLVTLPIVAAGVASVKMAADFEQQMSNLSSITNASGGTLERFRQQALQAGADTAFSAKEAAMAQVELAKGGLAVQDIMAGGLSAALGLAAAGELDLARAAATTANAMNLFGLKGKDSMAVADQLATAANATTADVGDFAMALNQGGSVAKSAGLSFTETMLALEALAKSGIKNSDAGTSLKAALIPLLKPTAKQAELAEKLGLNFLTAGGKMKSMADISAMLRNRLGGMTAAQRTATLATLAGTDGVRTLTSLFDVGPKKLKRWEKALGKSGTAATTAAKKQDNLKGKLEQLKGSLETTGIIIGSVLIPPLTSLAKKVTGVVNTVGEEFRRLPKGMQTAILAFFGLLAVMGPLIFMAGSLITAAGAVMGVIGAISLPVVAVVAALVALGVAFVLLWRRSETFRRIVTAGWMAVRNAIKRAVDWLLVNVPKGWKSLVESTRGIQAAAKWVATAFINVVKFLGPVWRVLGKILVGVIKFAWDTIKGIFVSAFKVITGIVQFFDALFRGDFRGMWNAIKRIFVGAIGLLLAFLKVKLALGALRIVGRLAKGIAGLFGRGWGLVKAGASGAWNFIRSKLSSIIGFVRSLPGKIANAAKGAFNGLKDAFRSALNWIIRGWNSLRFRIPGFDPPGPGPKFGGTEIGVPRIPELATGGVVRGLGSFISGEAGPELNTVTPQGVHVQPLTSAGASAAGSAAVLDEFPLRSTLVMPDGRVLADVVGTAVRDRRARQ